jgi:5-methylthioribose kinase
MRVVRKWLPLGSVVTVPEVHLFDKAQHVIVMDDAGEGSMSLEMFMQQGRATTDMAKEIGSAVGGFLAWLHQWGRGNEDARQAVRGNEWGKRLSAKGHYGDLKRILVDTCKHYDPPVEVEEKEMEKLERIVRETTEILLAEDHQVNSEFEKHQAR